jgi:hypothetical protein
MFIELTEKNSKTKILLNKNHIISVSPMVVEGCLIDTVAHNFGMSITVKESFHDIQLKLMGQTEGGK